MRVFYYRGGVKVCPVCWTPLYGVRRDAVAHRGCARERHRARQNGDPVLTAVSNGNGARRVAEGRQTLRVEFMPHPCPDCGNDRYEVRLTGRLVLAGGGEVALTFGPRKMLTCVRCGWRGSVARARDAA